MKEQIIQQLKQNKTVLIASHTSPDGDAIGSLIALGLTLEKFGKKVVLYNEGPIPAVYRFLPQTDRVLCALEPDAFFDIAIVLDCSTLQRIGAAAETVKLTPVTINIDHHVTNTGFGDFQIIDAKACASAEIVYELIKKLGVAIDAAIATSIYTGIFTDTGSFRFANTNLAAFAICNEMVQLGADPYCVSKNVYGAYSLNRIKLLNQALDTIEISQDGKLSMMVLTQAMMSKTGTQSEDVEGIINYARRIEDVKMAVLIHELKNGHKHKPACAPHPYHVSLRGNGNVDVASIAADFGGGGHHDAAGFNIESTLADIKNKILNLEIGDVNSEFGILNSES
ncbi:bifunctional oligoribonuclease/PAP phosphatase NrnA [Desulfococcaceae bacterium HSG7]|nr:bifunctional oligoribonuclease/PAP phosphatase NrnA [Desulfococcaceae bacterium HSG9]MDM8554971.1 bifunctional oligoribonuclease/PAP phosphatase NrnA [Desulfococcaceae bacterium HSG7]